MLNKKLLVQYVPTHIHMGKSHHMLDLFFMKDGSMEYKKVPLTIDALLQGYFIDTNGVLYSKYGRAMKPSKNPRGYLIQAFNVKGKMIARSMHKLVAQQFIPNPEKKTTVNHKDGDKTNNKVSNLEWATFKEQMLHACEVLGVEPNRNRRRTVIGCHSETGEVVIFKSGSEAARKLGVHKSSIYAAAQGKKKRIKGFEWKFG